MEPSTRCERCGILSWMTIMSRFNSQHICGTCDETERAHPRYAEAARAEMDAVRGGDYNFPGIGLPADLVR